MLDSSIGETGPVQPACGDGALDPGEECDDGNLEPGDTCSMECASTRVISMALGVAHMCVAFDSGSVRCWGRAALGTLGNGALQDLGDDPGELPVPDIDIGGRAIQVVAGRNHYCVLLDSEKVRCWGSNDTGQLGYGDNEHRGDDPGEMPTDEVVIGSNVLQIVAGDNHTCARVQEGGVRCWGGGYSGQLGYGSMNPVGTLPGDMPPVNVPGIDDVIDLAAGGGHTCVLREGGQVQCWGSNNKGQLGLGHTGNLGDGPGEVPPPDTNIGGLATHLSSELYHTCARIEGGDVRCWGENHYGQLGYGNFEYLGDDPGEMPPADILLGGPVQQVVAGNKHSCALLLTGKVKCWGWFTSGELGYGTDLPYGSQPGDMPPPDLDLGGDAMLLATSESQWEIDGGFTCALLVDGTMRCWGLNKHGQLGYGHTSIIGDGETPATAGPVPF